VRERYYLNDILCGAAVIHQLKCPDLGTRPTIPKIIFKCEIAGNVSNSLFFLENC
jgi:hypothetical protein